MTTADPAAIWQALNDRQRAYLECAYQVDQEREAAEGRAWARGGRRRPAADWRWLRYGHEWGGASALLRRVQDRGLADAGAGSTWAALARHGLVERRNSPSGVDALDVCLTPLGRRVVRSATGEHPHAGTRRRRPAAGQLQEWQWRGLALAYAAGNAGLPKPDGGQYGGLPWRSTWLRLRDWRGGGLVEEYVADSRYNPATGTTTHQYALRLTPRGRAYYVQEWATYRALYPNVDAPPVE